MPINLYTDPSHYRADLRTCLHPLLRPFIGKPRDFTDAARREMYGLGEDDFQVVANPQKAHVAILPMAWNYYRYHDRMERALAFWERSRKAGLTVFSWNAGDFGVRVPDLEGLIVHRCSGYRSKLPPNHRGMPVFITDPLKRWYGRDQIFVREKGEKPVVGFCGQAAGHVGKYALDVLRTGWRNLRYHLRLSHDEPQTYYPSTLLRKRALDALERDERIETNFIRRKKYRAGVRTPEELRKTTLEFYDNMVQSDYILCVRGGGNFSVRLYETLAMGRIPLLLDTDGLLPLAQDTKEWQQILVRTSNLKDLGQQVLERHRVISKKDFQEIQYMARMFWMNFLTLKYFFEKEILIQKLIPQKKRT